MIYSTRAADRLRCVSILYLVEYGFWIISERRQVLCSISFQSFIWWSMAFEYGWRLYNFPRSLVSILYLVEYGFWIWTGVWDPVTGTWSFNPLFGGVWLLNLDGCLGPCHRNLEFQSFIWWSMAFESAGTSTFMRSRSSFQSFIWWSMAFESYFSNENHAIKGNCKFQSFIWWSMAFEFKPLMLPVPSYSGFNPLFGGVWLLNGFYLAGVVMAWEFQSFIWWSMAFE